jgi:soluble lytic murein transglycosylase
MYGRLTFHPDDRGGNDLGRVQRRADRHEQDDSRGQYPRPRDNSFAQQRPRVFPEPRPQAAQPSEPEPEQPRGVFTENGAQFQKPARPHVPEYMKAARRQTSPEPQEFDVPARQEGDGARQNPYVLMSEKNADSEPKVKRRTLMIFTIAAAAVLAGVWISQLVFTAQTQAVYAARAAAEAAIANRHPFAYRELIEREAYANNLNPAFVAAIVLNESSFNPSAVSSKGARGLMQMMEDTSQWVYGSIGAGADYSFDLMYDAATNVKYGCWYLKYLSDKFGGDPVLVAAAFHSGQTTVLNWLSNAAYSSDQKTIALENIPESNTKDYVEKVMNSFAAYRRLYYEEVTV